MKAWRLAAAAALFVGVFAVMLAITGFGALVVIAATGGITDGDIPAFWANPWSGRLTLALMLIVSTGTALAASANYVRDARRRHPKARASGRDVPEPPL